MVLILSGLDAAIQPAIIDYTTAVFMTHFIHFCYSPFRAGLDISANLSVFLPRSDYGLVLSSLRGASHLVVTAAFSVIAALATALPTLRLGLSPFPERFFNRDCSLKLLMVKRWRPV